VLEARGREVHVLLDAGAFEQAKSFFDKLERQWDKRLEALKRFVEQG
jgi:hypothetical protein